MRKFFLTLLAFTAVISASATIVLPTTATQKLTLKGVVGQAVTITLGVYAPNDIYAVDFGDGVKALCKPILNGLSLLVRLHEDRVV